MHRIQFHYSLSDDSTPSQVRNPLIDLLQAVSAQGSISGGARQLGFSYRHVWGELKRWEDKLGRPLVIWEKGQRAKLTEFGSKLMWAEQQAQVRLSPQIDALRAALERTFDQAFNDDVHVTTLYASHDDALSALREFALGSDDALANRPSLHVDVRFVGSVDAIRALNEGRCMMAGFHTLTGADRQTLTARTYKPLLTPGRHKIIGFAERFQGLMVPAGNPLELTSLADVARAGLRFASRLPGSGTRVLQDELLAQLDKPVVALGNTVQYESSHSAVAQAVAAGQCDAGLGISSAAHRFGLAFVPLAKERYHLVCLKSELAQPAVKALLSLLQLPAWQARLSGLAGYTPSQSGEVLSMRQVLPWWDYRKPKSGPPASCGKT